MSIHEFKYCALKNHLTRALNLDQDTNNIVESSILDEKKEEEKNNNEDIVVSIRSLNKEAENKAIAN